MIPSYEQIQFLSSKAWQLCDRGKIYSKKNRHQVFPIKWWEMFCWSAFAVLIAKLWSLTMIHCHTDTIALSKFFFKRACGRSWNNWWENNLSLTIIVQSKIFETDTSIRLVEAAYLQQFISDTNIRRQFCEFSKCQSHNNIISSTVL